MADPPGRRDLARSDPCVRRFVFFVPLAALALLGAVLLIDLHSGVDPQAVASPMVGRPTPALDLPAFGAGKGRLTLTDRTGKPRLVNFFASWCGPCAEENALLVALSHHNPIEIDGVALKDQAEPLAAYLKQHGNPYTAIGMDDLGSTAIDWGVSGVPETFAIDADGRIVGHHLGALKPEDLYQLLADLTPN